MLFKASVFSLLFFAIVLSASAQENAAIYRSLSDYRMNVSQLSGQILIEKVADKQIDKWGVNDFKISSDVKALRKVLKNEAWGVVVNDSLFLNCRRLNVGHFYTFAEEINGEIFFLGGTTDEERYRQTSLLSATTGAVGAAMANAFLAVPRYWYVLNVESAKMEPLSDERMLIMLEEFPDLAEKYNKEPHKQGMITLKRYVTALRERFYSSSVKE